MTDLYDQDEETGERCPVCLQPWGDLHHFMYVRQLPIEGVVKVGGVPVKATGPVLTCTRQRELRA